MRRSQRNLTHSIFTDLNSTNHVYINEMEIPPQRKVALVDGDHITLGSEKFVFHINEQAQRI